MQPRLRTPVLLAAGLIAVLFLALFLTAQAQSIEPGGGTEAPPLPAVTPPPLDCTKPLPGKVTKLLQDDEIAVFGTVNAAAGWDDSGTLQLDKLDNANDGSMNLAYKWDWEKDSESPTYDIIWPAVTTADLDGDGKAEVVTAAKIQDLNGTLAAIAFTNPEVSDPTKLDVHGLLAGSDVEQGAELNHFDIAGGNLKRTTNGVEQAVVAFRDTKGAVHLLLTETTSSGGLHWFGEWYGTDDARTSVGDVAVDTGDLDGDGYDDEIVLAFADGNQDLQVIVLQWNNTWNLQVLASNYWKDNDRHPLNLNYAAGVDVTTGDFDGDPADEIAVAFRDGSAALQVMQMAYDPNVSGGQNPLSSTGFWRDTGRGRNNIDMLSLASGDIDGDGYDEIIPSFTNSPGNLSFVTLDTGSGTPTLRGSWENGNNGLNGIKWTSVDAGDIDKDARAEVVVSFENHARQLEVISFDDNPACPCADDGSSALTQRGIWQDAGDGRSAAGMTWIALGDMDGDSVYADYTQVCTRTVDVRMTALVGRPPFWSEWNPTGNEVGYGKSAGSESETEQEVTTSYGGSATVSGAFEFEDVALGPSITKDWENSVTTSTATGTGIETRDGWSMDDDGMVPYAGVTYYNYQYKRRDNGALARVGVPVYATTDAKRESFWNDPAGQQQLSPDAWVPAGRSAWMDPQKLSTLTSSYWAAGTRFWGEGSDVADLNANGKPDYLHTVVAGPYNSGHNVFYQVGFDLGPTGVPQTTSDWIPIWDSIGNFTSGLGAGLTELNGNATPELVLAWVDEPAGNHYAYYRVCWDLAANGKFKSCGARQAIPGTVGQATQGAGLDVLDVNGNGHPDVFFGWIDAPGDINQGHYEVGWDLDSSGNIASWGAPQAISGAFGPQDAGLGLSLDDMDKDGQPELVAAWVRTEDGGNEWAYSMGDALGQNGVVGSWAPGLPIAGWVGDATSAASLASADLVGSDGLPELVAAWIDHPSSGDVAYLRVGQARPLGGDPDQYPTAVQDTDPNDGVFQVQFQNQWWNVSGEVNWRWDAYNNPLVVSQGGANKTWSVDQSQFVQHTTSTSSSYNIEVGGEAKFMGVGIEGSSTYGFEEGSSQSISWSQGWYMEGQSAGLPGNAPSNKSYQYVPYTYMQLARSAAGEKQAYMVLDYIVPVIGPMARTAAAAAVGGATPAVPILASPTHPDPETWYPSSTVVFTWTQPAGDLAVVDGYRWYLDRNPDTVPNEFSQGITNTVTYEDFADGVWYLHLRARGDGGGWSETAHRAVRLDGHAPKVAIELNPARPDDNGGWYRTPVTATVRATDPSSSAGQAGSGVAGVEISADGVTWQPYVEALHYAAGMPLTALWARATDAVGHVSKPISVTFGLDPDAPNSAAQPGCWDAGGGCAAVVATDAMGNQYLHLAGTVVETASGLKGLAVRIDGARWVPASEVGGGLWSFNSSGQVGAGCHTFDTRGEDHAGNVETPQTFAAGVVWPARSRPDLSGSSIGVDPPLVRPGDVVTLSVSLRNSGWQETWVPATLQVPAGLDVLTETMTGGGTYDAEARTVTWPPEYLWPGQARLLAVAARVAADSTAATLTLPVTARGTWPIVADCPPQGVQAFRNLEETAQFTTTVTVRSSVPVDADLLPPALYRVRIEGEPATEVREVTLHLSAGADARWMVLKEWRLDADGGGWVTAQESGWVPFAATYPYRLSEGEGVRYVGAWVADSAGNVSTLDQRGLALTNLTRSHQALAGGQRIQYRFPMGAGNLGVFNAVTRKGNADLYVWEPGSGFRPQYAAAGTGLVDTVGLVAHREGLYLVEVQAVGETDYQLLLAGNPASVKATSTDDTVQAPEHPLAVSDPLSAGAAAAPEPPGFLKVYLPAVVNQ